MVKFIILGLLGIAGLSANLMLNSMKHPEHWESAVRTFEEADRRSPLSSGGIVFTGGSTIRFWRSLQDDMQPLSVINRGFGGAQMLHVTVYARRLVNAYRPSAVVLYAGENDLGWPTRRREATPETVCEDFKRFVQIVHSELPRTWMFYVSINPTPFRKGRGPAMEEANRQIREFSSGADHVEFIDVSTAMLDARGQPQGEIWRWDGLHPNERGYALLTSIIKPALLRRLARRSDVARTTDRTLDFPSTP